MDRNNQPGSVQPRGKAATGSSCSRQCPRCGYRVLDPGLGRCPRCRAPLVAACQGQCQGCLRGGWVQK